MCRNNITFAARKSTARYTSNFWVNLKFSLFPTQTWWLHFRPTIFAGAFGASWLWSLRCRRVVQNYYVRSRARLNVIALAIRRQRVIELARASFNNARQLLLRVWWCDKKCSWLIELLMCERWIQRYIYNWWLEGVADRCRFWCVIVWSAWIISKGTCNCCYRQSVMNLLDFEILFTHTVYVYAK